MYNNLNKIVFFLLLFSMLLSGNQVGANVLQQNITVTGVVTDQNGSLPGVNVTVKGTSIGVVTDFNGNYSINVPNENAVLQFSFVGYVTFEEEVGTRRTINVEMTEDTRQFEEVVVVAFGTAKREAFTGSAGVVNSESIKLSQQTNVAQTLVGKVAGVQLANTTGQFGSSPSILIRGPGSISSSNEPLYVVDGMPYDGDLNNINPSDIETMTVLKDAASNALYGARGANGVIMITTRKAQSGEARIVFDTRIGVNSVAMPKYDYITDPAQWYEIWYQSVYNYRITQGDDAAAAHAFANDQLTGAGSQNYLVYTVPQGEDFIGTNGKINPRATLGRRVSFQGQDYWLEPENWEKEGTRHGLRQEYNLSATGGDSKLNYFASLGYLKNEGITVGSDMKRTTARIKVESQAKKWMRLGANMSYTNHDYNRVGDGTRGSSGSIWSMVTGIGPIYPVYIRDGNKNIMIDEWGEKMYDFGNVAGLSRPAFSGFNPIFSNKFDINNTSKNAYTTNGFVDFTLLDGLKVTINGGVNLEETRGTYVSDPFAENYGPSQNGGSVGKEHWRNVSYNTQQIINYTKSFNSHTINAMVGHEYYINDFQYLYGAKTRMSSSENHELNGAITDSGAANSYSTTYNNEGYFFRLQYDYSNKLFFSGSFRRDASSRFHVDHRWGNFWSFGSAWLIDRENWFPAIPALNMLKLKASIGSQGNDGIGEYRYADVYNIQSASGEVSFVFDKKGKEDITWETNTNFNAGIEFGLFNNRLSGTFDYFYRKTSNMLFEFFVAPSNGYTSYFDNVGDMRNSGIELDLNGDIIRTSDLVWNVNFNITHLSNKILSLPKDKKTLKVEGYEGYTYAENLFAGPSTYFFGENLPLRTFYTRKYAGVDDEGLPMWYKDVVDANGNVTGQETTYAQSDGTNYLCGNAMPKVYGGFGTYVRYKGFDLSANFNYRLGGVFYEYDYSTCMGNPGQNFGGNIHKDRLNSWTPENRSSRMPRLNSGDPGWTGHSDEWLTKGNYLNLQNVNFGYTLPGNVTGRFGVALLRVYVSMENVWFTSTRKGFDPRYSFDGMANFQVYPSIRTISGGVTIQF